MKRITRNRLGQFTKKKIRVGWVAKVVVLLTFPTVAICNAIDANRPIEQPHFIEVAEAKEEVKGIPFDEAFIINYDWDEAKAIEEIRKVFTETPGVAVAVARCESSLKVTARSQHILWYGQEESYNLFQIHAPDWEDTATELGLEDFKTNPYSNIKLAYYIYKNYSWSPWTTFKNGCYKQYL